MTTPRTIEANPFRRPRTWLRDRRFERRFVDELLWGDRALMQRMRDEIEESGLIEHLAGKADEFWATVSGETYRGTPYNTGRATGRRDYTEGVRLYALIRDRRPSTIVETGVCNGFSTAFLLAALHKNAHGTLHSIDFPEVAGETYEPGTFWEGKAGSVVPPGEESGWAIPEHLRASRWHLNIGKSEDTLPGVLEELGTIDMFMHDSAPIEPVTSFEYGEAWPRLSTDGLLVANNYTWTPSFDELVARTNARWTPVSHKMAIAVKP